MSRCPVITPERTQARTHTHTQLGVTRGFRCPHTPARVRNQRKNPVQTAVELSMTALPSHARMLRGTPFPIQRGKLGVLSVVVAPRLKNGVSSARQVVWPKSRPARHRGG